MLSEEVFGLRVQVVVGPGWGRMFFGVEIVRSVLDEGCIQVVMIVFAQTWQVIGKREGIGFVLPKPWGRFVCVGAAVIGVVECIGRLS